MIRTTRTTGIRDTSFMRSTHEFSPATFPESLPRFGPVFGILLAGLALASGCTSKPISYSELPMRDGSLGVAVEWDRVIEDSLKAEIVVIGEEHDDPYAHGFQRTLIRDLLALDDRTAIALEMLERDEQAAVDAWLDRGLSTRDFVTETGSKDWGGADSWWTFYQPILDAARDANAPIIAANAPREFVRQARIEGFEVLEALPTETRATFELPITLEQGDYWIRFRDLMREMREEDVPEEEILPIFRSQMVWDATMASSAVRALDLPEIDRVVLLVGRFHSDFKGGTIREIRRLRPDVELLVISCVRSADSGDLSEDDLGRADILVHTDE